MSLLTIIFFGLCCYLAYYLWRQKKLSELEAPSMKLNVPRGPIGLPFVGHILYLGYRPFETLFKWMNKYGPIFRIKLGSETIVVLNGTDIIREALIDHSEEFAGRPHLYMIHATLKGKGIISSPYNKDFNEHKTFLINKFNKYGRRRSSLEVNCLQTVRDTLYDYRENMTHELEYSNLAMKYSLSKITSQNVLTMAFGTPMYDKRNFGTLMELVTENFQNAGVSAAFNFLPITRIFKNFILKNVVKCSEFLNDLISEKMREFDQNNDFDQDSGESNEPGKDSDSNIIECYLKELMNNVNFFNEDSVENIAANNGNHSFNVQSKNLTERRRSSISSESIGDKSFSMSRYRSFSFDHLSSLVQDLFVAGTETISNSLNWAIVYATYYQEFQKELFKEIDTVLGKEKPPSESDRAKLHYVEAFINESLRFHCSGPILIPRSTTQNVIFRGYEIPENTFIMVNMWSCMRDPLYWNEPNKFDPTRFIDSEGKFTCRNPAMMPFSVGKRACTGENLARIQLFLIFTSLIQKFIFTFANKEDYQNEQILKGISGFGLSPPNVHLKINMR